MSQLTSNPGLGVPLSSNNKANPYLSLGGSGGQLAGVEALNGQSGILAITGDSSIGITFPGSGQIQVSTAGKAQAFGTVSASTVVASGAVSGATVSSAGAVNGATVVASGAITGSTLTAAGGSVGPAGSIAALTMNLGSPNPCKGITYQNNSTAYTSNNSFPFGVPVAYRALITLTASANETAGGGATNFYCTWNAIQISTGIWSLRENTGRTSNGLSYGLTGDNSAAGPQIVLYVNAGTAGTIYASWKVEPVGV